MRKLTVSPFQGHLWYLSALLYVLIIISWLDQTIGRERVYWIIPVLLLGDLIFGKYSLLIWERSFPTSLVRNWLFVGLPYFLLGDYMNKHQNRLNALLNRKEPVLFILFIGLVASTLLEKAFLVSIGMNAERNHYISSTFLSITAFIIALKQTYKARGVLGWFAQLGKRYSTMIYIIHPAIISTLPLLIIINCHISESALIVYRWITPVLVFFISLTIAILSERIRLVSQQK